MHMIAPHSQEPRLSRAQFLKGAAGFIGTAIALSTGRTGFASNLTGASVANVGRSEGEGRPLVVYFGTGAMGMGIHVFEMSQASGALTPRSAIDASAPGWITLDPSERFVYAAIDANRVSSFAIDESNASLALLNTQTTGSGIDAHISVDPSGRFVVGASYDSGTVSVLPIRSDGRLDAPVSVVQHTGEPGPHPNQTQPHPHMAVFDPSARWLIVPDLGLDRLYVYSLDTSTGRLVANATPYLQFERGRGPRHIAFHPDAKVAYVINELSSIMTVVTWDSTTGTFQEIQAESTLPEDWTGRKQSAEVVVHPSGRFVYGSNRNSGGASDDIVIFRAEQNTGRLVLAGHAPTLGQVPRNFNIEPSGRFLVCPHQNSNNVVVFTINQATGELMPTGQQTEVPNAICTQFAPNLA
jgi:6-phosphogluconolactonase